MSCKEKRMDAVCSSLCVPVRSRVSSATQRTSMEFGFRKGKYFSRTDFVRSCMFSVIVTVHRNQIVRCCYDKNGL